MKKGVFLTMLLWLMLPVVAMADNQPPEISEISSFTVNEESADVTMNLTDYFSDPDGDLLSHSAELVSDTSINGDLISLTVSGADLILSFGDDAFGVGVVEVYLNDGEYTATESFRVTVNNINDIPTVTSADSDSISENTSVVMTVVAADVDGDTLSYSIHGGADGTLFKINSSTGLLSFKSAPDYEDPQDADTDNDYVVEVEVADDDSSVTQSITVSVEGVNDAPVIAEIAAFSVDEDASYTQINLRDYVSDQEDDSMTFDASVVGDTSESGDLVDLSIQAIFLKVFYDEDNNGVATIQLAASDPEFTVTRNFTVTVNPVNDAPVSTTDSELTVTENLLSVVTATGTDIDSETVTFSITGDGADDSLFSINTSSGALSFISAPNYEDPVDSDANNVYTVEIALHDGEDHTTQEIDVTVVGENESPFVSAAISDFSVSEDAADSVLDIAAIFSDPENDTLSYDSFVVSNSDLLSITDDGSSTATVSYTANGNGTAVIEITATDGAFTATDSITITVDAVDDAPTVSGNGFEDIEVYEDDDPILVSLDPVFEDIDSNSRDYSVLSNSNASLVTTSISDASLTLTLEEDQFGVAVIEVELETDGKTVTDSFTLTVIEVNDAIIITSDDDVTVSENETAVLTVVGDDQEGDTVTYSITGGVDANLFAIDDDSGVLTFVSAPNFEDPDDSDTDNEYILIVGASDGENLSTQSMTVTVVDINEEPVISSIASIQVDEDAESEQITLTDYFSDPDNDTTYSSAEVISDSSAGEDLLDLSLIGGVLTMDFTEHAHGVAVIAVYLSDIEHTVSAEFTVTVNSINDRPTIESSDTVSVSENVAEVITVLGEDIETENLEYSITGGDDKDLFNIDSSTGALTFVSAPDYEDPQDWGLDNVYDVKVKVYDGDLKKTQDIVVTVLEVNEPPFVVDAIDPFFVNEDAAPTGISVTSVFDDPEGDDFNYYSLVSVNSGLVSVVNDYTMLTLNYSANENGVAIIELGAYDGEFLVTHNFKVTVNSINDAPTVVSNNFFVSENRTAIIATLGFDIEGDDLTYDISGGSDASYFRLDGTTGVFEFKDAQNFESPSDTGQDNIYDIEVQVSDDEYTITRDVTITITDINETPVIVSGIDDLVVDEDSEASEIDISNLASDPDTGEELSYSVLLDGQIYVDIGGDEPVLLDIISSVEIDGSVLTLNYLADAFGVINVDVGVSDGEFTVTDSFVVTVNAKSDPPYFTTGSSLGVSENLSEVKRIKAIDPDGTSVSYAIVGGADFEAFTIEDRWLTFVTPSNYEVAHDADEDGVFEVVVSANSAGDSVTRSFTVQVSDVNESPVVLSPIVDYVVDEDSDLTQFTISSVFDDEDEDYLTLNVEIVENGHILNVTNNQSTLTVTYNLNENGVVLLELTAFDGEFSTSNFITVTVNAVDDAPTINLGIEDMVVDEDAGTVTINLAEIFEDVDSSLNFLVVFNNNESLISDNIFSDDDLDTHELSILFEADQFGEARVMVQASANGQEVVDSFLITVNAVDDAPVVSGNGFEGLTVDEDSDNVTFNLNEIFVDIDSSDILFRVTANSNESVATTTISNDDILTVSFVNNQFGELDIEIEARADGQYVVDILSVTVNSIDDAPTVLGNGFSDYEVNEDSLPVTVNLAEIFKDIDSELSYLVSVNTNESLVTASFEDHELTILFLEEQYGTASIDIAAWGDLQFVTDNIFVTVNSIDDVVEILSSTSITVTENNRFALTILGVDVEDTDLSYDIIGGVDEDLFLISPTSDLSFVSSPNYESPEDFDGDNIYVVDISVQDSRHTVTQSITIEVLDDNESPVTASELTLVTVNEDAEPTIISMVGLFTDPDANEELSYRYQAFGTVNVLNSEGELEDVSILSVKGDGSTITVNYTENAFGVARVDVGATDGEFTVTESFVVSVNPVSELPEIITSDSITITENETFVLMVEAIDVDNDLERYVLASGDDAELFNMNTETGRLSFISAPNYEEPLDSDGDNDYILNIGVEDTENRVTMSLRVTVIDQNEAPELHSEIVGVTANEDDESVTVNIDFFEDPEGIVPTYSVLLRGDEDVLTFDYVEGGTWITLNYLENANGIVLVDIGASDGVSITTETMTVTVNSIDDSPVALGFTDLEVDEDAALFSVDLDNVFEDVDTSPLVFTLLSNSNADVANASIVGDFLNVSPKEDMFGVVVISVEAKAGIKRVSADLIVTVNAVDDSPVILGDGLDDSYVLEDSDPDQISLETIFEDIDSETIVYSVTSNTADSVVSASVSGTVLTLEYLENQLGTATINVEARADGQYVLDEMVITVRATNDAPVFTTTDSVTINEDEVDVLTVDVYDVDSLVVTFGVTGGDDADLFEIGDESGVLVFSQAPDYENAQDVNTDNIYELIIGVHDEDNFVTQAITVTVLDGNDAPYVVSAIDSYSVVEDSADSVVSLLGVFDDSQEEDELTYSASIVTGSSVAAISSDQERITVSVLENAFGEVVIEVSASDGEYSVTDSFVVTVTAVNDAPTLIGTPNVEVDEDSYYYFRPTANDIEDDTLVFSIVNKPSWAEFDSGTGALIGTPNMSAIGSYPGIVISVSDGSSSVSLDSFSISVNSVEDLPEISGVPSPNAYEDSVYSFIPTVVEEDGDDLVFSIINLPEWARFSTSNGALTGEPEHGDQGQYEGIEIGVFDGSATVSLNAFAITVNLIEDAPLVTGNGFEDIRVSEDAQAITVDLTTIFEDPNDEELSFVVSSNSNAEMLSVTVSGTELVISFESNSFGESMVIIEAEAGRETVFDSFHVTVNSVNDAPYFVSTSNLVVLSNQSVVSGSIRVIDVDSSTITLNLVGGADQDLFGVDASGNLIALVSINYLDRIDADEDGDYELVFTATDGLLVTTETVWIKSVADSDTEEEFVVTSNNSMANYIEIQNTDIVVSDGATFGFENGASILSGSITVSGGELGLSDVVLEDVLVSLDDGATLSSTRLDLRTALTIAQDDASTIDLLDLRGDVPFTVSGGTVAVNTVAGDLAVSDVLLKRTASESDIDVDGSLEIENCEVLLDLASTIIAENGFSVTSCNLTIWRSIALGEKVSQFGLSASIKSSLVNENRFWNASEREGDEFPILSPDTASSMEGKFSSVSLPTLEEGLSWDLSQLYKTGVVSVISPVVTSNQVLADGDVLAYPNPVSLHLDSGEFEIGFNLNNFVLDDSLEGDQTATVVIYIYDMFGRLEIRKEVTVTADNYSRVQFYEWEAINGEMSAGIYLFYVMHGDQLVGKGKLGVLP